jgi:hypothetical protein
MSTEMVPATPAGSITRQEHGALQVSKLGETAITAAAAQAKAEVESQYIVALQRPRDLEVVRDRFLRECSRPALAKIARYSKPVGGSKIEGPSVRLAEVALRVFGNVRVTTPTIYDDTERRIVRVSVFDLETNASASKDITVTKTVERSTIKDGQTPLSVRTNSGGKKVYTVEATDDDLANKEAALVSKTLRNLIFRIFPGWLLEEGMEQVQAVLRGQVQADPDAAKRAAVDAFSELGIRAEQLADFLGHKLDETTPDELVQLRAVYSAIKDGETTWTSTMEQRREERGQAASAPAGPAPSGFKDKVKAKAAAAPAPERGDAGVDG